MSSSSSSPGSSGSAAAAGSAESTDLAELERLRLFAAGVAAGPVHDALTSAIRQLDSALLSPYFRQLRTRIEGMADAAAADGLRAAVESSRHAALALAVHSLALDCGFQCVGGSGSGASSPGASGAALRGFAPAIRPLPASAFVPGDWAAPDRGAFSLRYSHPAAAPPPAGGDEARFYLAMLCAGPLLVVHAREAGPSGTDVSVELDTARWTAAAPPSPSSSAAHPERGASAAAAAVLARLLPLAAPSQAQEFCRILASGVFLRLCPACVPYLARVTAAPAAAAPAPSPSTGAPLHRAPVPPPGRSALIDEDAEAGAFPGSSGVFGIPRPLGGRPGDFDQDLYPDFRGAAPGYAIGGGGGVGLFGGGGGLGMMPGGGGGLMGPDHPMFGGGPHGGPLGGGMGGGLPPGVPPGARFDPFGPGVPMRGGGALRGRGRGRGGASATLPGEPPPDHLRPPPDAGEEPPPDIYW